MFKLLVWHSARGREAASFRSRNFPEMLSSLVSESCPMGPMRKNSGTIGGMDCPSHHFGAVSRLFLSLSAALRHPLSVGFQARSRPAARAAGARAVQACRASSQESVLAEADVGRSRAAAASRHWHTQQHLSFKLLPVALVQAPGHQSSNNAARHVRRHGLPCPMQVRPSALEEYSYIFWALHLPAASVWLHVKVFWGSMTGELKIHDSRLLFHDFLRSWQIGNLDIHRSTSGLQFSYVSLQCLNSSGALKLSRYRALAASTRSCVIPRPGFILTESMSV